MTCWNALVFSSPCAKPRNPLYLQVGSWFHARCLFSSCPSEKRKRPRAHSPSGTPVPGSSGSRPVSITLPPRTNSVGPTGHPRDSRGKKDSNVKQPALQPGRKVVFRPPKSTDTDEGTWIVAIVTRFIGPDKQGGKYEVQDAEPQDDGQPGM